MYVLHDRTAFQTGVWRLQKLCGWNGWLHQDICAKVSMSRLQARDLTDGAIYLLDT